MAADQSPEQPPPPEPPAELGDAGARLWRSVTGPHVLDEHEVALLLAACRTTDVLDRLAAEVADADSLVAEGRGGPVAHPSLVEMRQQSLGLARLLAALRVPSGEEQAREQRRGGARGPYTVTPQSRRADLRAVRGGTA